MWVTLARIAATIVPKDKLLYIVVFVPLGFIVFLGLLISGPGNVYKHVPLGQNDEQFNYYINAAKQIQTETTILLNWQEIMAIDAVLLEQDFSKSSQSRAHSYKRYFVREEQQAYPCPVSTSSPGSSSSKINSGGAAPPPPTCYRTVYFQRTFDEALQLLVRDGLIKANQIEDVKNYTLFVLTAEPEGDNDIGGIHMEGNFTVKSGKYAWPLPATHKRVTSPFSTRKDPFTGKISYHKGVDFRAAIGTEIYAMDDATVSHAGDANTAGIMVILNHGNGVVSKYMHLDEVKVSAGQKVTKGDLIGLSGNTGRSTAPHLHFQIEIKGKPVDPLKFY
ncbi:M23 family metallopeptidase [Paenibacillus agilis]|uniref:M23 family metallopeptidase n=1 Tax=Paenibacillus agilis TaxID=3020863 RepID=A0A559ID91_9BACL|nr:M23 family metallopeptidase [Paenibacillus agilis]TVX85624.1 M23 family metallopeptidase [Paenibacillus agilis]